MTAAEQPWPFCRRTYAFVPDYEAATEPQIRLQEAQNDLLITTSWYYGFELGRPTEAENEVDAAISTIDWSGYDLIFQDMVKSLEANRGDFYGTYSGLFFPGIILSVLFLAAAVLIILQANR